jgi:hypothetical protein
LLLGFARAFRRPELVALNVEDLEESEQSFEVTIRHSKTDRRSRANNRYRPRQRGVPGDGVEGVAHNRRITSGPIFGSVRKVAPVGGRLPTQVVADIVKASADAWGSMPAKTDHRSYTNNVASELSKLGPLSILKAKMNPDLHMARICRPSGLTLPGCEVLGSPAL